METASSVAQVLCTFITVVALDSRYSFANTRFTETFRCTGITIIAEDVVGLINFNAIPGEWVTSIECAGLPGVLIAIDLRTRHHLTSRGVQACIAEQFARAEIGIARCVAIRVGSAPTDIRTSNALPVEADVIGRTFISIFTASVDI